MTADLVAFLRARLDDTERKAKAVLNAGHRWTASAERFGPRVITGLDTGDWWDRDTNTSVWQCDDPEDGCTDTSHQLMAEAAHIADWDPARVLAEVDAKRRILDLHSMDWRERPERGIGEADDPYCIACFGEGYPCETLRLLALPYADHPDYRKA